MKLFTIDDVFGGWTKAQTQHFKDGGDVRRHLHELRERAVSGVAVIRRRRSVIPGFGLTMGVTLLWLSLIVLIPLAALFLKTSELSLERFVAIITSRRVLHALELSFGLSLAAAAVNLVFGSLVVWALVRYDFPGKRVFDAIVDIPFALPTAVAGIALTSLYSENGWLGSLLAPLGIKVAFTPLGIFVALVFIGLPFVVRTVQPVLENLETELEEAAASLGAGRWYDHPPCCHPDHCAGFADRLCARLRARGRRIRLRDLHCRQSAECLGDRAASDRDPARGIPLRRCHRHRGRDAGRLIHSAVRHQRPAALVRTTDRKASMSIITAPYDALALEVMNGDARAMALRSSPAVGPRSDHPAVRWTIIGVAVAFLALFIILPLVNVFVHGLQQGRRPPISPRSPSRMRARPSC